MKDWVDGKQKYFYTLSPRVRQEMVDQPSLNLFSITVYST